MTSRAEDDSLINMSGFVEEYRPGKWRVAVPYEGKKHFYYSYKGHRKDPRLETEVKALQLLADINKEIDKGTFDPDVFKPKGSIFLFENAAETWIDSSDCSEEWLARRRRIADMYLIPYFRGVDIRGGIKQIHIKRFITDLRTKHGLGSKTIYNVVGELKAMLNSFRESIPYFPNFPTVDFQKPAIKWIGEEQQDQIFEFIPSHHKSIFIFMKYSGCRPNEARGLLRENIHLNSPVPHFVLSTVMNRRRVLKPNTKTKKCKPLPIVPEIIEALKSSESAVHFRFVFTFRDQPYSETTLRKIWRTANQRANEKYGTPVINLYNGLKHSFGCQRLNDGFSLTEVQTVMGHTDSKTTQRYAEYVTSKLVNVMRGKKVVQFELAKKMGQAEPSSQG